MIATRKNQIRRIDDATYEVRSQTDPDTKYTLVQTSRSWNCSCPDYTTDCKHAFALEHRLGDKARPIEPYSYMRWMARLNASHQTTIWSNQSRDMSYEVQDFGHGWMCSCPDHLYTGTVCKHIQAVQWHVGERHIIQPYNMATFKFCNSSDIIMKGVRHGKQQYGCKTCGKRFIPNLGFENRHSLPEQITLAVGMFYGGLSSRKTANKLRQIGCVVSHMTVYRWAKQYGVLMESYMDNIRPLLGELWRTDEIDLKVRGKRKYLFAMLDAETRYWIARQVATHKGTDDVRPMFVEAKRVAGKVPSKLISDGAANFAEAHHDMYTPKNHLWKDSVHEPHVHLAGDINNDQMESFNGNTIRMREKVTRGLKKDDSAILSGLQIYHNHVRPHQGLPYDQTPGEAAGIHIYGENKRYTLIQAAAKAKQSE